MAEPNLLTVPGWTGAGSDHWMSCWERNVPRMRRVEQPDWDDPRPELWAATLEVYVANVGRDVVLIAHSCGVLTVRRWVEASEPRVTCAFLVALPDPTSECAIDQVSRFGPLARDPLPFRSMLIASRTDPDCDFEVAARYAEDWGAELINAGDAGHINTASGYGSWTEGRRLLNRLIGS